MRFGQVNSAELREDGRRLNAGYFLSEDEEAVRCLRAWPGPSAPLLKLVSDVYSGPIFRKMTAGPGNGVGYVSAIDVFKADVRPNGFLSYSHGRLLDELRLAPGTIILTCSGMNLGRSIWVREDMSHLVGSGDLIRIRPNAEAAPPGYVFSFMSSRYGVASVRRLIFGGHIKHVAPSDVGRIRVPRLAREVESRCDELVRSAAQLRAKSADTLRRITSAFDALIGDLTPNLDSPILGTTWASKLQARMDAQFHDPNVQAIRQKLEAGEATTVGAMCSVVILPGIFKRIHALDEAYGAPYFTGSAVFSIDPVPKGILSTRTSLFREVQLQRHTVLVQAFGQDGGITGRATWVGEHLHGATTTHMLCRLRADDPRLTAYLFGFFSSEAAYQQLRVLTYGGSIPHFDEDGIRTVVVPLLGGEAGALRIGTKLLAALDKRDKALFHEREARALVERAIEEAA